MNAALTALTHPSGGAVDADSELRSGVKNGLTPGRSRRVVENDEFAGFVGRVVSAYGRRVASGDIEALGELTVLDALVHAATRTAIRGLRVEGYSWAEIGDRLNISRQAAQQRWGE